MGAGFALGYAEMMAQGLPMIEEGKRRREALDMQKRSADLQMKLMDMQIEQATAALRSGEGLQKMLTQGVEVPTESAPEFGMATGQAAPPSTFRMASTEDVIGALPPNLQQQLVMHRLMQKPERPAPPQVVAPGGHLVDPATGQPIFSAPDRPEKARGPQVVAPGGVLVGEDGAPIFENPAKAEKAPSVGGDRDAVAMEKYNKPFADLTTNERSIVNKIVKQDKVDVAGAGAQVAADVRAKTPEKPTAGEREALATDTASIEGLQRLGALYKPEFVGPVRGHLGEFNAKTGMITPGEAQFRASVAEVTNTTIRALTGSALSTNEQDRIIRQIPAVTDQPVVFEAKMKQTMANLRTLAERRREILTNTGVDLSRLPLLPGGKAAYDYDPRTKSLVPVKP